MNWYLDLNLTSMLVGWTWAASRGVPWPVRLLVTVLAVTAWRYAIAVDWYAVGWYAVQYAGIEGPGFLIALAVTRCYYG